MSHTHTKRFLKKRYIISLIVTVALVGGGYILVQKNKKPTFTESYTVQKQDIQRTVISTGSVISERKLSLSFKNTGALEKLNVKVGDMIKAGQVLAELTQRDAQVAVSQARAQLAQAQANYEKVLVGATSEDVGVSRAAVETAEDNLANAKKSYDTNVKSATTTLNNAKANAAANEIVARTTVDNAKKNYDQVVAQQKQLVQNAYSLWQTSGLEAVANDNNSTVTTSISGVYSGTAQGKIEITLYSSSNGLIYNANGVSVYSGLLSRGVPLSLGSGLFITFSTSGTLLTSTSWTIDIPNTRSSVYLVNENAYKSALQTQAQALAQAQSTIDSAQASYEQIVSQGRTSISSAEDALDQARTQGQNAVDAAESALTQAKAAFALKVAAVRPQDVAVSKAQIALAQSQLEAAENTLENNTIIAPIDGQVTAIVPKLGEQVSALKEAIVLLDREDLHVEANIPETSIGSIAIGQRVDMTFDAFGQDRHAEGRVLMIDPASTVVSGVIQFRIVTSLPKEPDIKPGMTVNLNIITGEKTGVLTAPNRLIRTKDDKKVVSVKKGDQPVDVEITTGLEGNNYTEITSGLSEGDVLTSPVNP